MKHKRKILSLIVPVIAIGACIGLLVSLDIKIYSNPPVPTETVVEAVATHVESKPTVSELLALTNAERAKVGVAPLVLDDRLNGSAGAKCADMDKYNYWAHDNPNGTTPWDFIKSVTYYQTAGENLAQGFTTSNQVVTGWMNSETHKANVLSTAYTNVGYGICTDEALGTVVVQHLVEL